jgi:integrase/recombinase XerD
MNRSSQGLLLSQAVNGSVKYKVVEGLSDTTLTSYQDQLDRLLHHLGDTLIADIDALHIEDFIYWLRTDYEPQRVNGKQKALSGKTIYNYWVTLKSFFGWAHQREFITTNPMDVVPRPKFNDKPFDPFTREEIDKLLQVCRHSRLAETNGRRPFMMGRPTYRRDEALILFLLDTGLRASELCALRIRDVDMSTGEVIIRHGKEGGAKGAKGRTVFIGKATKRTLWRYLVERGDKNDDEAPLFTTVDDNPLNRDSLRFIFIRLGKAAGLKTCHPHMFRHTFAINYLRSDGDVLTLQTLLGHTSLEMVKRYARIAKIDLQRSHGRASPVDNWGL